MISKESHEYWLEGKKNPQFGSPDIPFSVSVLRSWMSARQEPADKAVQCMRTTVDHIPCEWVLAPGADPDLRLLYLHGGGLTLATLLALRDRGLPLPKGGIPMSAFADLTLASESILTQVEKELYLHPSSLPRFAECYASVKELRNPLVSPVFGDYTGIPPLLIQAGDYEVLRDDSVRVADKAKADGVDVKLEIWPGQVHVFQIRGLPESRQAIGHIADFIRQHVRSCEL